jgi:hypothetical protein
MVAQEKLILEVKPILVLAVLVHRHLDQAGSMEVPQAVMFKVKVGKLVAAAVEINSLSK